MGAFPFTEGFGAAFRTIEPPLKGEVLSEAKRRGSEPIPSSMHGRVPHKKNAPHQGRSAVALRGTTRVCRETAASHRDNGDESVRAYPAITPRPHGDAFSRKLRSELHPPAAIHRAFSPGAALFRTGMKGYSLHHSQIEFILAQAHRNYNGLFKFLRICSGR